MQSPKSEKKKNLKTLAKFLGTNIDIIDLSSDFLKKINTSITDFTTNIYIVKSNEFASFYSRKDNSSVKAIKENK